VNRTKNELESFETTEMSSTIYGPDSDKDIYLLGYIESPDKYNWILPNIRSIPNITIYINSPGGIVETAVQIMSAMSDNPTHVHAQIEGAADSSASIIALSANSCHATPGSSMLLHDMMVSGPDDRPSVIIEVNEFHKKWFADIITRAYRGFLSKREIKSVLAGNDIRLMSDEINARLKKRGDRRFVGK